MTIQRQLNDPLRMKSSFILEWQQQTRIVFMKKLNLGQCLLPFSRILHSQLLSKLQNYKNAIFYMDMKCSLWLHKAHKGHKRNVLRILEGKHEEIRQEIAGCEMDSFDLGKQSAESCCEHGNEHLGSIKFWKSLISWATISSSKILLCRVCHDSPVLTTQDLY